jgi:hypothetical protein
MMDDGHVSPSEQYAPARDLPAISSLTDVQREICRRIIEGESVRTICKDSSMPAQSTVFEWLARDPEFRAAYSLAKQLLAETLAEEILEISNTPQPGVKTTTKADGSVEIVEGDMIEHRRLQVDARKWLAGKLAPKRYGDSSMLRVGGMDADRGQLSREEIVVRLAAIFAEVQKRKD